jgi:hypothetical protein
VQQQVRTLLTAALGLAAIVLAGTVMGYLSPPLGLSILVLSLGAAAWLWRRGKGAASQAEPEKVESGLRIVEKPLDGKPTLRHGLRVTISTEMGVSLGLRVVCDKPVSEAEPLAQTGRGSAARQGVPAAVRESRQAWLFVVQNSPRQRELFLRVDLFAAQPFQVVRVEQIRPGGRVALPEWKELELRSGGVAPEVPGGEPASPAGEPAPPAGNPAAPAGGERPPSP